LGLLGLELLLDPALVRLLVVLLFGVKRRGLSLEIGADLLREREMVLRLAFCFDADSVERVSEFSADLVSRDQNRFFGDNAETARLKNSAFRVARVNERN
jgi:hypothetical protein